FPCGDRRIMFLWGSRTSGSLRPAQSRSTTPIAWSCGDSCGPGGIPGISPAPRPWRRSNMEIISRTRILAPVVRHAISACFVAALLLANVLAATAQHSGWIVLPNAPVAGRHDDIHFLDPQRGWAVSSSGKIHRTTNGGATWVEQFQGPEHFRSGWFSDAQHGWAGTLGGATLLCATTDGGATWQSVNLPNPRPEAICGMSGFGGDLIVATGAYHG